MKILVKLNLVNKKDLAPKYVKFILANRFYTHKIDFLPEKVDDDLDLFGLEVELIMENNQKMIRSYFNDIRGLISRIYVAKISYDMKQGLNEIIFKDAVYHKFTTVWVDASYEGAGRYLNASKVNEVKDLNSVSEEITKILLLNKIE